MYFTAVDCGPPVEIRNALAAYNGTKLHDEVIYICEERYEPTVESARLVCGADGMWFGQPSVCQLTGR